MTDKKETSAVTKWRRILRQGKGVPIYKGYLYFMVEDKLFKVKMED